MKQLHNIFNQYSRLFGQKPTGVACILKVKLWIKGAYIRGSANDLFTFKYMKRLPKKRRFFMVSLAYLVKRRSVEPENRVRSRRYPKEKISWLNWIERRFTAPKVEGSSPSEITKNVNFKIDKRSELIIDYSRL